MGFMLPGENKKYCLKLSNNIYMVRSKREAYGTTHVNKGLLELGYKPSMIDPCVYYHGRMDFMIYLDDGILLVPIKQRSSD